MTLKSNHKMKVVPILSINDFFNFYLFVYLFLLRSTPWVVETGIKTKQKKTNCAQLCLAQASAAVPMAEAGHPWRRHWLVPDTARNHSCCYLPSTHSPHCPTGFLSCRLDTSWAPTGDKGRSYQFWTALYWIKPVLPSKGHPAAG